MSAARAAAAMAALVLVACSHEVGLHSFQAPAVAPAEAESADGWTTIRAAAAPADFSDDGRIEAGRLRFRGGLHLQADFPRFGGLSGLYVDGGGAVLAVTDEGWWLRAKLAFDKDGALTGLVDAKMAPMRDAAGAPFASKAAADAEGLARLPDGRFAVSFERDQVVRLYDLDGKGPTAPAEATLLFAGAETLGANQGLEAVAPFGDRLLVGAENGAGGEGAAFWFTSPGEQGLAPMAGFAPTAKRFGLVALDRLPDGDFVAVERFYAPLIGPRIIVRRVKAAGLNASPPRWETEELADLAPPLALDNFEGVSAVALRNGQTRLYLISDDNFRRQQRTLLYAFDLIN